MLITSLVGMENDIKYIFDNVRSFSDKCIRYKTSLVKKSMSKLDRNPTSDNPRNNMKWFISLRLYSDELCVRRARIL